MRFNFYKLKSLAFSLIICLVFAISANAQPLMGTKTIDPLGSGSNNYLTLKAAIDSLNIHGVGPGGVTFNIVAGFTETAPTGGYALTATGTAANPIIFQKGGAGINPLLTAYTGGTGVPNAANPAPDGIFRLVGSDYVTIDGIDLAENASNTANPATMEYGYALFKASKSDGCQHVTIQNCVVTLSRINFASSTAPMVEGSVGILSINAKPDSATTVLVPTTREGTNSYNKFYANKIENVNYGIALIGYAAPSPYVASDTLNDIGGATEQTGNTIINFGGGTGSTNPSAAVRTLAQYGINVSNNTVNNNNGSGLNHTSTLRGIYLNTAANASANINNNSVVLRGGGTTSQITAIENVSGGSGTNNTINITNNDVGIISSTATSASVYGIYNQASAFNININSNIVDSIKISTATSTATVYGIFSSAGTNNGVRNNTVKDIQRVAIASGTTIGIYLSAGANQTVKNNTIHDFVVNGASGTGGTMYGIQTTTGTLLVDSNTIYNLTVSKTSATTVLYGVYNGSSPTNENFNHNTIYNLTHNGTGTLYGMFFTTVSGVRTVSHNTIHTLSGKSTLDGIRSTTSTPSIFNNKIYNLASSGTAITVSGITITSLGTNGSATVYNNFISDLRAPLVTSTTDGVRGINITSTSAGNMNIYHNTIYLNATSTGANFSTSGVFHTYSATATNSTLVLRNNIIVNNSVPNGTGVAVALRRSASTNLGNYGTASNTNLLYAGTPSVANLIFYDGTNSDQTLTDFKTRVAPRENYSVTENVQFVNTATSDLHVVGSVSTLVESNGIMIPGFNKDIDGDTRPGPAGSISGGGLSPDLGADEIDAIPMSPFGDITPPTFVLDSISPAVNTCLTTSHTFYATVTDASGLDSVLILWTLGSQGNQTPIMMTSTGGGKYTGTIPSFLDSAINYSFRAVDLSPNKNTVNVAGGKYKDITYTINIVASATTVTAGTPINLEVKSNGVAELGTATTTNANNSSVGNPYPLWYGGGHQQYLILASELAALGLKAGAITSVSFDVGALATTVTALQNYTISMATTTSTALTAFQTSPAVSVVYGPINYTPILGVNEHVFTTPFNWDGTSNVIVDICFNNGISGTSSLNYMSKQTATPFTSSVYYQVDSESGSKCGVTTVSGSTNLRPNMLIKGSKGNILNPVWTETPGGGLTSTNTVATTATPNTAGLYTYSVQATNGICAASTSIDINVLNPAAPIAAFSLSNDTAFTGGFKSTITLTDQSLNLPSSWNWSFIPNKVTYVNSTSSTSKNPQVQFDSAGLYSIKLVVSNVTGADSLTKVDSIISVIRYCVAGATGSTGQDIGQYTIVSGTDTLLDNGVGSFPATNNSLATGTYSDFTQTVPPFDVHFGKTYNFTISHIASASSSTSGRSIYLDLNHDGDFSDAGEKLFSSQLYMAAGTNSTGSFTIPRNAPYGLTRMRVVLNNGSSDPSACGTFTNGEVEDYVVRIVAPIGDFYPPDFSNAGVTPPSGSCLPTSHVVSVTITDTTGVDSAWVIWSIAGVNQPNIHMSNTGSSYSATIPAVQAGKVVAYSFRAKDNSVNHNIGNYAGGNIVDAVFNVDGQTSADSIVLGNTVNFDTKIFPIPQIGNGTTTGTGSPNPYYTTFWGNKQQYLITAGELAASGYVAGNLTSLSLNVGSVTTTLPLTNFTISMGHTTTTAMTSNFVTGLQQVYLSPSYVVQPNTVNTHVFTTPFVWDGVSNIIIETCFNNSNWNGSQTITYTTTPFVSCLYFYDDISTVCTNTSGTTSSNRPNFTLGQVSTVSLNWTSSSANAPLSATNIANPSSTPTALGTYTYYVTGNNGTCSYTDSIKVKVLPPTKPVARFGVDKKVAFVNSKVTFSDSTLNLPDSVFWSFTPNTVTYVNSTNRKSKNPEVNFTAPGLYSVKLVAQNLGGLDSLTKVDYVEVIAAYCASAAANPGDEDIGRVRVGNLVHNSPGATPIASNTLANKTYTDNLSVTFSARIAVEDTIEVSIINAGTTLYESIISAWIDFNKDGTFDNNTERIMSALSSTALTDRTKKAAFKVPVGSVVGNTVMRVISWETGFTPGSGPCGSYGYGETEDYLINILPPPPGDYYPPVITNITVTPDSNCTAVSHTVTASIFDTTGVDSAWIYYTVNNVAQTPIYMPKPTTGTIYSGVIPAQGSGVVRFRIFARDLSTINVNSIFSASRTYQDRYFNVSAGADVYVGAGQSATLSANTSLDRSFRITEFNLFNYTGGCGAANGSQCTWPTNLASTMYDDNLEVTNLSSSPADLSGYTLLTEGNNSSITFPPGTIVPPNGVVIVHLSSAGSEDPASLIFKMTSGNFTPSSGSSFGIVLKNAQGMVIDAVALNTYSFTSANGVTSTDWSGSGVSSPSGQAGATLQGADLNNSTNWVTASLSTPVSIGYLNPSLPTLPSSSTITWTGGLLTSPVVGATITTPTHPSLGTYDYIATSSNGVCTSSDTVRVNVVSGPTVSLGGPNGTICGTTPRILDAGNPGSTYVWRRNNVQVATTRTYAASTAGTYKVTVTNQAGISASDSIVLTIGPAFTITMPDRTLCTGGTITVDAGTHVGYLWSTGATTQTIQITQNGSYHVSVTNSLGCVATDTFVVTTATPPPTFTLGADQTLCGSSTLILDAGNPGSTYLWSTGATTQTINASLANTYHVTVTTNSGCILRDTVVVTNLPAPVVNLGPDQSICPGSSITLDAGNAGASFSWNTGATTQTLNVTTAGTYIVTVTGANTCSTKDTIVVTMKAAPSVNLGNDLNICTSDTVTLDAANPGASYLWSTGATTRTIRVSNAGTYSVVVTHPTTGCTATDAVVVTNKPTPASTFSIVTALGQSVTFIATTTSGLQYAWNFGDPNSPSNTSQLTSPTHLYSAPGTYTVTLTVTATATGCKSTSTETIVVLGVGNDFAEAFKLGAAPNPFITKTNVSYTLLENADKVSVEIYDMIGRKVATIIENESQLGNVTYNYEYKNEDLQTSSGMYIVRLTVDGKVAYTRIVDAAKR